MKTAENTAPIYRLDRVPACAVAVLFGASNKAFIK